MESSGSSMQRTNDRSTGSNWSSRQRTSSMSLNINQDKNHHHEAGDRMRHPSDDENYDRDDRLSVTAEYDFAVTVDGVDEQPLYSKEVEKIEGDTSEEGQIYESRICMNNDLL